jgi:hypothetical protein
MVNKGCKPVAIMALQNECVEEAKERVEAKKLHFYSEVLCEGWSTIYAYKHEYLLDVIKSSPEKPKTVYDHWVLGKLFGYSDEEIRGYVEFHAELT